MSYNQDIIYCNGVGCNILRDHCRRYVEGERIKKNANGDTNQYWWIDHCDVETRESFITI